MANDLSELQVKILAAPPGTPPVTANAAGTSLVHDLVVLSFGYFNPLTVPPPVKGVVTASAPVFQQIAMPRSSFAGWLRSTLTLIAGAKDRDAYGWAEIQKALAEHAEDAAE